MMQVINSARGKESHTPFIPNILERTSTIGRMAAPPLTTDMIKANLGCITALRKAAARILIPANKNPVKYSLIPLLAIGISAWFPSLLNICIIGSENRLTTM